MLNRIIVMGRMTRDPELRRTNSGTAVASFTVAVDRDFKSQSGEKETDFIDVVAWRNTAEFVSKYFSKGRMAVVEAACSCVTGPTRTAINAAPPRSWPTACILAIPSGTAETRCRANRRAVLARSRMMGIFPSEVTYGEVLR